MKNPVYTAHVRWATPRDLDRLAEIEAASFADPMDAAQLLALMRDRLVITMVAEDRSGNVAGFAIYRLRTHAVRLLRLAVAPDSRREGVGAALLAKMKFKTRSHKRSALRIDVPEGATAAHLLLKSAGIKAVGVRDGVYRFVWLPLWEPSAIY